MIFIPLKTTDKGSGRIPAESDAPILYAAPAIAAYKIIPHEAGRIYDKKQIMDA